METLTRKYGPWKEIEIDGIKALARRQKDAPSFAKWEIVEAQTKLSLMPPSWPGGLSAGTLEGAKHIVQQEVIDKQGKEKILQRIKEAIAKSSPATKEPWQMTREEFVDNHTNREMLVKIAAMGWPEGEHYIGQSAEYARLTGHYAVVKLATNKGLPIPPEVIKEYPDLSLQARESAKKNFEEAWSKAYGNRPKIVDWKAETPEEAKIRIKNTMQRQSSGAFFSEMPKTEGAAVLNTGHLTPEQLRNQMIEHQNEQIAARHEELRQVKTKAAKTFVQSPLGIKLDKARLAKHILPRTKAGLARHKKHPNRYDIRGMDTPSTSVIRKR